MTMESLTFMEWLKSPGPPNWVFVTVLLTGPYMWRKWIVYFTRKKFGFPPKMTEGGSDNG